MSQLLGIGSGIDTELASCDQRTLGDAFRMEVELSPLGDFLTPWWPGTAGFIGALGSDVGVMEADYYEQPDMTSGSKQLFGVLGVTRDVYGSPLGGCTVKLYRTSTDEMVYSIVSDPQGNYLVQSPYYPDQHYIVIYKAGAPDVFGTTANTLVGS